MTNGIRTGIGLLVLALGLAAAAVPGLDTVGALASPQPAPPPASITGL